MADEDEIGSGARNELTADLIGGGTDDGAPQTGREEGNQENEEDDDEPARRGAPAQRTRPIVPSRRRGCPRA